MSEAKHTPGPWYTGEPFAAFEGGTLRFHISQADGAPYTPHYSDVAHLVAETVPGELLEIQRANARLIAAAPELLDLVEEAMSMLGSQLIKDTLGYDWHEKANAAIAKVTGHPHD